MKFVFALVFILAVLISCAPKPIPDLPEPLPELPEPTEEVAEPVEAAEPEAVEEIEVQVEPEPPIFNCLDNLDRFAGVYTLSVISKEVGIPDYSNGAAICGAGGEYFGDIPTLGTITVDGKTATLSISTDSPLFPASGDFKQETVPKIPLVAGSFYKTSTTAKPVANSCGTKSPYFTITKKYAEDNGQTTLTLQVYTQEDALTIVSESFWIEDNSKILSPCHGVMVLQGIKQEVIFMV